MNGNYPHAAPDIRHSQGASLLQSCWSRGAFVGGANRFGTDLHDRRPGTADASGVGASAPAGVPSSTSGPHAGGPPSPFPCWLAGQVPGDSSCVLRRRAARIRGQPTWRALAMRRQAFCRRQALCRRRIRRALQGLASLCRRRALVSPPGCRRPTRSRSRCPSCSNSMQGSRLRRALHTMRCRRQRRSQRLRAVGRRSIRRPQTSMLRRRSA